MRIVVGKIDVGLFHYLVNDQTCMEFPWQAQAPKLNPPVSSRILTTSVGYMKGLRQICRPVASGRQDSSTDPSRLLNPDMLITSHSWSDVKINSGCESQQVALGRCTKPQEVLVMYWALRQQNVGGYIRTRNLRLVYQFWIEQVCILFDSNIRDPTSIRDINEFAPRPTAQYLRSYTLHTIEALYCLSDYI